MNKTNNLKKNKKVKQPAFKSKLKLKKVISTNFLKNSISFFKKSRNVTPNAILLILLGLILIFGEISWYSYSNRELLFGEQIRTTSVRAFSTLKISLVNDLHALGTNKDGKFRLLYDYQEPLNVFFTNVNQYNPDLIVANGDMIEGTRRYNQVAMKELVSIKEYFENNTSKSVIWTVGNHELRAVDREQWKQSLGINYNDHTVEIGQYKLIFFDSQFSSGGVGNNSEGTYNGRLISDDQLAWLNQELSNSNKIKIIFTHCPPLAGLDQRPNYLPAGVEQLQKLFSSHGVAAVFSGHIERLVHENIDGVDYYVFPGVGKNSEFVNAFSRIRMINNEVIATLFYKDENGILISERIN